MPLYVRICRFVWTCVMPKLPFGDSVSHRIYDKGKFGNLPVCKNFFSSNFDEICWVDLTFWPCSLHCPLQSVKVKGLKKKRLEWGKNYFAAQGIPWFHRVVSRSALCRFLLLVITIDGFVFAEESLGFSSFFYCSRVGSKMWCKHLFTSFLLSLFCLLFASMNHYSLHTTQTQVFRNEHTFQHSYSLFKYRLTHCRLRVSNLVPSLRIGSAG